MCTPIDLLFLLLPFLDAARQKVAFQQQTCSGNKANLVRVPFAAISSEECNLCIAVSGNYDKLQLELHLQAAPETLIPSLSTTIISIYCEVLFYTSRVAVMGCSASFRRFWIKACQRWCLRWPSKIANSSDVCLTFAALKAKISTD